MIDDCVSVAITELQRQDSSLSERIAKGEQIIAEQGQDMEFVNRCKSLLTALKILKMQVNACLDILENKCDFIVQEGSTLCIAKTMDDKAKALIKKNIEYCDVVMERKETAINEDTWNVFFGR